jgi:hypothetical protein
MIRFSAYALMAALAVAAAPYHAQAEEKEAGGIKKPQASGYTHKATRTIGGFEFTGYANVDDDEDDKNKKDKNAGSPKDKNSGTHR